MKKIILALVILASPVMAWAQACTSPDTQQDGLWSDSATWVTGSPEGHIEIAHRVTIDQGMELDLTDQSIIVCADGGALIGDTGAIKFHVSDDTVFLGNENGPNFNPDDIGLWVFGEVDFKAPEVTSWEWVVPKAGFAPYELNVDRAVSISSGSANLQTAPIGWQVGDTLVLASEMGEFTTAELTSINGTAITYDADSPITAYALRYDGDTILPAIGNLSRRFVIESADVTEVQPNRRAHTVYMAGATTNIENVEFRNLGPRKKLGRYPVHFHLSSGANFTGNSIWQSVTDPGNRFVTVHGGENNLVDNNVMFRSMGHGIVLEDRNAFNNTISNNLTVYIAHTHNGIYFEELRVEDEMLYQLATRASNHIWGRTGNDYVGNVMAGYDDDAGTKNFAHVFGIGILPSNTTRDRTTIEETTCLGCGGFAGWHRHYDVWDTRMLRGQVHFEGLHSVNTRVSGYYPLLLGASANDLLLLFNGHSENVYSGAIFTNSTGGDLVEITNVKAAGEYLFHNHYYGEVEVSGVVADLEKAIIDPTYFENPTRIKTGTINSPRVISGGTYPNEKFPAPSPLVFEDIIYNGQPYNATWVRYPIHSRMFTTVGSAEGVGIQIESLPECIYVEPPAEYLRDWWTITPVGGQESNYATYISRDTEARYNSSVANGFNGCPHGMPAGEYTVRYYTYADKKTFLGEEDITVGTPPPIDEPPIVTITTRQELYADTDGKEGEFITFSCSATDAEGAVTVEWLLNNDPFGSEVEVSYVVPDGDWLLTCRGTDSAGQIVADSINITVEAPPEGPCRDITVECNAERLDDLELRVETLEESL